MYEVGGEKGKERVKREISDIGKREREIRENMQNVWYNGSY